MSNCNSKTLIDAVSIFLADDNAKPQSTLELLSLSKSCILQRKKVLPLLKGIILQNFENLLKIVEDKLVTYQNLLDSQEMNKIHINSTRSPDICNNNNSYTNTYDSSLTSNDNTSPVINNESNGQFNNFRIYKKLEEDIKFIAETLNTIQITTELLCKCLFPLNINKYFLDRKIPYLEKAVKVLIYKKLKKNFTSIKNFICILLMTLQKKIHYGNYNDNSFTSIETEVPYDQTLISINLKSFLNILKTYSLRRRSLNTARKALITRGVNELSPYILDFEFISTYFQNQQYIYPVKLHNNIEKSVLQELYKDMETEVLIEKLDKNIKPIYVIFCMGMLKEKLLQAFSNLFLCDIKAKNFQKFIQTYLTAEKIIGVCKDDEFNECFYIHLRNIAESPANCVEIANYIDLGYKTAYNLRDHKIVVKIIEAAINPELILTELQEKLAFRILELKKIDSEGFEEKLIKEKQFLTLLRKPHSENMLSMIKDITSLKEGALLMKMCKWPVFSTEDVSLSSDNPIVAQKIEITNELKEKKMRVSWVDSLAIVTANIYNKVVKLSLFQFSIITLFIDEGHFTTKSNLSLPCNVINEKISPCYKPQFTCLLGDLILVDNDIYILNSSFKGVNYLNFSYKLATTELHDTNDFSYNISAFNQARISKFLKKTKNTTVSSILDSFKDIDRDNLHIIIEDLQSKSICERIGDDIIFCP